MTGREWDSVKNASATMASGYFPANMVVAGVGCIPWYESSALVTLYAP